MVQAIAGDHCHRQEIGVTALQLAMAYGAIANGGVLMAPRIVAGTIGSEGQLEARGGPQPIRRVVSRKTAATLSEVLTGVVENGTGQKGRIRGVAVAGKTGTAQRALADGSGYDPNARIASFVGFLPANNPQYVCVIMVENPRENGWGGRVAAPAFRQTMKRIISLPGGLLVEPAAKNSAKRGAGRARPARHAPSRRPFPCTDAGIAGHLFWLRRCGPQSIALAGSGRSRRAN